MYSLKVTTVGNSLAITIPKELAAKLRLAKGDPVFLRETQDGFVVSPYDPEFARAMELAAGVSKKYRDALRDLASK
jgi:putative addiction module antidote